MEGLLASRELKIKDFKQFVDEQSKRIVQQAEDIARKKCVRRDGWWEICQGREAMFRRPEQDRMIPLCIDQQLAIDAEQRSPANRNPVLTRRSYLIKGDDTDWRIAVALEARCHCAESSRPRFSALPGPLCCRFGFPVY